MESVLDKPGAQISSDRSQDLEAARLKLTAFLAAWRLPAATRETIFAEAMLAANCVVVRGEEGDPTRIAIETAEKLVTHTLDEFLGELEPALEPQRALENHLTTMEPKLHRLPSFRMVAGWFLLVVLLFLTFIFTHQP